MGLFALGGIRNVFGAYGFLFAAGGFLFGACHCFFGACHCVFGVPMSGFAKCGEKEGKGAKVGWGGEGARHEGAKND